MFRKAKPARIAQADAAGFVLADSNGRRIVPWHDVERITAFKRDLYTVDMICLLFSLTDGRGEIEINEQMDGYETLLPAMHEALPAATPWAHWFLAVAFPAFAPSSLCIYRRGGEPDPLPSAPVPDEEDETHGAAPGMWARCKDWVLGRVLGLPR